MAKKQKYPHLLGSKWTARETTFGWRHFQVVNRKNQGSLVFAELIAACDPSVRFWINAKALRDRGIWNAGWQPLHQTESGLRGPKAAPYPPGSNAAADIQLPGQQVPE